MRGKTIIRCTKCDASSEKTVILVLRRETKCVLCAGISGIVRDANVVSSEELQAIMDETNENLKKKGLNPE